MSIIYEDRMGRQFSTDQLAVKPECVMITVVVFALTRGTVADLLVTDGGVEMSASAVLVLSARFGTVLYDINLVVSARDRTYARTVLAWFVAGAKALGLMLGPLLAASSPRDATTASTPSGTLERRRAARRDSRRGGRPAADDEPLAEVVGIATPLPSLDLALFVGYLLRGVRWPTLGASAASQPAGRSGLSAGRTPQVNGPNRPGGSRAPLKRSRRHQGSDGRR